MNALYFIFGLIFLNTTYGYKVNSLHADVECPQWTGEIIFLPDPEDCGKYYVCDKNGPVNMPCPAGLWWNKDKNECDWPSETTCDSDCPEPYTKSYGGQNCYLLANQQMNFYEAEEFCRNEGGKLAEPKSDTETSEIDYLIKQTNGLSFWIGLSDYCGDEGVFTWKSDGSILTYTNWKENEPNNYLDNEDCVQLNHDSQWNDLRCLTDATAYGNVMTALCQLE